MESVPGRALANVNPAASSSKLGRALTELSLKIRYERRKITEPARQSDLRYPFGRIDQAMSNMLES
jgi:hypothetical protein